tara:strand:+ start:126 stop:1169 length:1044 start_codon:yes stop_codon:yes gene_type:complete
MIEFKQISSFHLIKVLNNINNLIFKTKAGSIQRCLDRVHLNNLIEFQENFYKNNKQFFFPSSIILAEFENKFAILDGQHRICSIEFLNKKYKVDFKVPITFIYLNNIEEYDMYFIAINKNKPVQLYKNINDWKEVLKDVNGYLLKKYKPYFKNSKNPHIPHLNIDLMNKYIEDNQLIRKSKITYQEFIDEIENLNIFYCLHWKKYIYDTKYIKNISTYIEKCNDKQNPPFFLGIFKKFEWIDRIMYKKNEKIEYENMEHICRNYRTRITKKVRKKVWSKRNNKKHMTGKCFVCEDEIDYDSFECGHIQSVFYGGKTNYNNLEPICTICNGSMGIMNLNEFKTSLMNS